MSYLILVLLILFCAYRAIRAARLINVTIWLAVTSALAAVLIYFLGAPEVAVIELSVGAGLVTVLFVFAFSITGEATFDEITLLPRSLIWVLVLAVVGVLAWLILPIPEPSALDIRIRLPITIEPDFGHMLWQQRGLDVIVQMVLIFAGVMGLLGLLSTSGPRKQGAPAKITRSAGPAQPILETALINPGGNQPENLGPVMVERAGEEAEI